VAAEDLEFIPQEIKVVPNDFCNIFTGGNTQGPLFCNQQCMLCQELSSLLNFIWSPGRFLCNPRSEAGMAWEIGRRRTLWAKLFIATARAIGWPSEGKSASHLFRATTGTGGGRDRQPAEHRAGVAEEWVVLQEELAKEVLCFLTRQSGEVWPLKPQAKQRGGALQTYLS
jgi:hypothetical protein